MKMPSKARNVSSANIPEAGCQRAGEINRTPAAKNAESFDSLVQALTAFFFFFCYVLLKKQYNLSR